MTIVWFVIAVLWFIGLQIIIVKNLDKLDKTLEKQKKESERYFWD